VPCLPGESPRAFEAFCAFLELGPRRRYAAVARKLGVSLRTIKRWAIQFDWRQRLNAQAAQTAGQFVLDQADELADTVARERSLRDRQLLLADAVLDLTERYFERMDDLELEHIRFSDVCRALEFASRLLGPSRESGAATPDTSLRDQLASLLDQAFPETPKPAPTSAVAP
jgi:transposase-like protein